MIFDYIGHDAGDVLRQGTREADTAASVIAQFWPHGWVDLTICPQYSCEVVGQIGRRKGRRAWWAKNWSTAEPKAAS